MKSLAERQREFAGALLDARQPVPEGLACPPGVALAERFAVYRNNVAVALTESLRSTFPVVEQLVGSDCFNALALPYALRCPPQSAVLLRYGEGFADYLQANAAAIGLPYLADVARIEWDWIAAYYAAEAEPLDIGALQQQAGAALPHQALRLHPALRWRSVGHSAYSIWSAHRDGAPERTLQLDGGPEHLLLVRARATVLDQATTAAMIALLEALAAGHSIVAASECALACEAQADLAALFSTLFETGAVIGTQEPPVHAH